MRAIAYILVGVFGGMGMMTVYQGVEQNDSMAPVSYAMSAPDPISEMEDEKPWTGEDLLEMAQLYDRQADELQSEAVRLEQRAISLAEKPYMDPKGFTRTGWMLIATSRWKSAKELREMAAMHRSEGQRLLALEKNGEIPTENRDKDGNSSQKHGT
ncbi:MAG: hypothetical protein R3B74_14810 [Nitrospirales bacterium]|nr:hypothetical protein [Nitrospirales bacterium]